MALARKNTPPIEQGHTVGGIAFTVRASAGVLVVRVPAGVRVRVARKPTPKRWAGRRFHEFPRSTQKVARARFHVMQAYAAAGRGKKGEASAIRKCARLLGKPCSDRTIRSWAKMVRDAGPSPAKQLEALLGRKSCPHLPRRKKSRTAA